jgi:hypothetical protein
VGFVVGKVALGRVFFKYFDFPCESSFHQLLHNHPHISSGADTIGQKWPQYKRLSPTPLAIKKSYKPEGRAFDSLWSSSTDLILPNRTMALGSTQPLTEKSTRNLPEGNGRPARKADKLTAICEPIVYKMWEPRPLTTRWASTACYRDRYTLAYLTLMNT